MHTTDNYNLNLPEGTDPIEVADLNENMQIIDEALAGIPTSLADLTDDSTHRTVTDAEKSEWDDKADVTWVMDEVNTRYYKPVSGIPETDLADSVQAKLNAGAEIYPISIGVNTTISSSIYAGLLDAMENHKEILMTGCPSTSDSSVKYLYRQSSSEDGVTWDLLKWLTFSCEMDGVRQHIYIGMAELELGLHAVVRRSESAAVIPGYLVSLNAGASTMARGDFSAVKEGVAAGVNVTVKVGNLLYHPIWTDGQDYALTALDFGGDPIMPTFTRKLLYLGEATGGRADCCWYSD